MNESLSTIFYLPLVGFVLLTLDQLGSVLVANDLATVAAARAACAVQRSIGHDGHVRDGIEEHAQTVAALALWPDASSLAGSRMSADPEVEAAARALAESLDIQMNAPFEVAMGGTTLTIEAGRGSWRSLRSGSQIDVGEYIRVIVTWSHPLRADPSALLIRDGAHGATVRVTGEAMLVAGGGC